MSQPHPITENKLQPQLQPLVLALDVEEGRPLLQGLHRRIQGMEEAADITRATYLSDQLIPVSKLCELFQSVRADATASDFVKFLPELVAPFVDQEDVHVAENAQIKIVFTETPSNKNYGFAPSDPGHAVEGPILGLVCGNTYQSVRIGKVEVYRGSLRALSKGEDPTAHFSATFLIRPEGADSAKTSRFAVFSKLNPLPHLFQSRLSTITTLATVIGIIAIAFGYFAEPHHYAHVMPALNWAWSYVPSQNATMAVLEKGKFW